VVVDIDFAVGCVVEVVEIADELQHRSSYQWW
jgi:hypothetical protein